MKNHYLYQINCKKKKKKLIQKLTDESSVKVKKVGEFVLKSILAICVKKITLYSYHFFETSRQLTD